MGAAEPVSSEVHAAALACESATRLVVWTGVTVVELISVLLSVKLILPVGETPPVETKALKVTFWP